MLEREVSRDTGSKILPQLNLNMLISLLRKKDENIAKQLRQILGLRGELGTAVLTSAVALYSDSGFPQAQDYPVEMSHLVDEIGAVFMIAALSNPTDNDQERHHHVVALLRRLVSLVLDEAGNEKAPAVTFRHVKKSD